MTEPNEKKDNGAESEGGKYQQLALFSVIVAEVVVTPSALGGAVYWLLRDQPIRFVLTFIAAFCGLIIAFIRVYQIYKLQQKKDKT